MSDLKNIPLESLSKEDLIKLVKMYSEERATLVYKNHTLEHKIDNLESINKTLSEKVEFTQKGVSKIKHEIEKAIWYNQDGVKFGAIDKTVIDMLSILNM